MSNSRWCNDFFFNETRLMSNKCVDVPVKVKVLDNEGNPGVHYTHIPTNRVHGKVLLGLTQWKLVEQSLICGKRKD